jgi:hypothetical protein
MELAFLKSKKPPPKNIQQIYSQKKYQFFLSITASPNIIELVFADGFYLGQINPQNNRNGKGLLKYLSGDIYYGDWKEGSFHGKGTYIFSTG